MRILRAFIVPLITIIIIVLLNRPAGSLPALGRLLDPVNGWAANAESVSKDFSEDLDIEGLQQPVTVWMEDRMVPHIHAANDHDLYFMQGYIHAYFRLWQMEFQTMATAGRISEVVGEKWVKDERTGKQKNAVLEFDRGQRRKGMVFAAENSLEAMESDKQTKGMLDAYTAGVNKYISSLCYKTLPLEYKLMGYSPEPWTNLKCALLLKYMADDLTGYTEDIPLTLLRDALPQEEFDYLYPQRLVGSTPVIPPGTKFDAPSLQAPPIPGDSVWSHLGLPLTPSPGGGSVTRNSKNNSSAGYSQYSSFREGIGVPGYLDSKSKNTQFDSYSQYSPSWGGGWGEAGNGDGEAGQEAASGIGSNNWAISGGRTASGGPILCNDPHLGLNLPSLWFETQLQAPGLNVYGVSLPGAPGVVIGFNDSISWGFTNNYRDVKDFYEIEAIDKDFYRFDGLPKPFDKRVEIIKIKGKPDYSDTVSYTVHGPVMYGPSFPDPAHTGARLALCWMAHRSTNELLSLYLLNRAGNYVSFTDAILHFECPAQNMVYADREGNIAMWGQGQFVNKWKDQGRYVMKGNTSATLWGQDIPMIENPHVLNPLQGYLASANQITTDSTYPYWYNGYFYDFRAWRINELLAQMTKVAMADNMTMQQDVTSVLARNTAPLLNNEDLQNWNYRLDASSVQATKFQVLWSVFYENLWKEKFAKFLLYPSPERTMQLLITEDTSGLFYKELVDAIARSGKETSDSVARVTGSKNWSVVKGSQLTHLAKLDAFSYKNLEVGGWGNTINAVKKSHGPSWRMVVEMDKDSIRAMGVYPGGQSGNPGSKYYGTFVNSWVKGQYYRLAFLPNVDKQNNKNIKYTWNVQPK